MNESGHAEVVVSGRESAVVLFGLGTFARVDPLCAYSPLHSPSNMNSITVINLPVYYAQTFIQLTPTSLLLLHMPHGMPGPSLGHRQTY